ncbi:hypothetical protein EVAR_18040_1 [Eumeta japonica]|uniref:Uncharacterized protein n=1 Tax=Eumeta variegata TaxID=151549 RepID=A0A4C1XX69_EUMVA|nr:hypothetical protein EVAR_18040_1 [Eumeta japonica]
MELGIESCIGNESQSGAGPNRGTRIGIEHRTVIATKNYSKIGRYRRRGDLFCVHGNETRKLANLYGCSRIYNNIFAFLSKEGWDKNSARRKREEKLKGNFTFNERLLRGCRTTAGSVCGLNDVHPIVRLDEVDRQIPNSKPRSREPILNASEARERYAKTPPCGILKSLPTLLTNGRDESVDRKILIHPIRDLLCRFANGRRYTVSQKKKA